jgi:AcrR family transcriptional regulator
MAPDRKQEILIAAGKCFTKYGYDKTTLDDIGEMVGMNKVSLYYYFKNKEAIFAELITGEADKYSESIRNKVESIDNCKEKILSWIKEGFKYNETNSILHQLSFESLKRLSPQLEELKNYAKDKGTEYLKTILKNCRIRNEIIACDVNKVAQTIQNVAYSMKDYAYQHARTNQNSEVDFKGMVDEILFAVSLILDGIVVNKSEETGG